VTGALSPKTPPTVNTGGFSPSAGIAVTADGASAYVTDAGSNTISQYSIDAVTGALSPRVPATVMAGGAPFGIAATPSRREPTGKEQCKNGGWRSFPQFRKQGECIRMVNTGT
jgi:YVTN family beta-propeller protein